MKLCFSGLEQTIEISKGTTTVLEVHNRVLFERICRSLIADDGEVAIEPFALFDDEGECVSSRGWCVVLSDPLHFPWKDRAFTNGMLNRMVQLIGENPDLSDELQAISRALEDLLLQTALQLNSDYNFAVEWDVQKHLKAFSFGTDTDPNDSFLDNLIKFLSMAADMHLNKVLVLVNFKLFLSKMEFLQVCETVFSANLPVLMVETIPGEKEVPFEKKYVIDQHFLES